MNNGELKAMVEDFVQIKKALYPKMNDPSNNDSTTINERAEQIAGQIVAGKAAHGDYRGKGYYEEGGE